MSAAPARTRVLRGTEDSPWELWRRSPPPRLAGYLAGLWAARAVGSGARHRLLPNGELWLMFHLGPPQQLVERDGTPCAESLRFGYLAGLQERPYTVASPHPNTRVVVVRLLPLGAAVLLRGLPLAELTGRVEAPDAVFESCAGLASLRQRMQDAVDLGAALDAVEAWLHARLAEVEMLHAATRAASQQLRACAGRVRVDEIARDTGLSARRLHELFRAQVGVAPKRYARILRFRHSLDRLSAAPALDLAGIAQDCGYFDQAHLNRDFRELAQLTPGRYREVADPQGDGADVVPG
jgi:AraC-like DNA-binding protein